MLSYSSVRRNIGASSAARCADEKDDVTMRAGVRQERMMQHTQGMNKGGEETSSVQLLTGMHRSVQRWRRREDSEGRSRAGQIIQRAMEGGAEQTNGNNGEREAWDRTCTAQRMTPQRSPFQANRAGSGIVVHEPLQRRQTPYPRFVVTTTGTQAARRQTTASER